MTADATTGIAAAQRRRLAEALARRAAALDGPARALLHARLDEMSATSTAVAPVVTGARGATAPGPIAALVARLGAGSAPADGLKSVHRHRAAWTRLRVEQRLQQALATVPDQAGPLNTQRLVHRALAAMHSASPGYLQHFMGHVEALLRLEQAGPTAAARPETPPRRARGRPARTGT